MKYILFALFISTASGLFGQPTISFTFDDGITADRGAYKFEEWNEMILKSLDRATVHAIFFVKTDDKSTTKGQYLLESWDNRGHGIANHTYSHPNFNNKNSHAVDFKDQLLKADSLIKPYDNYVKLFRFPYLKEGKTRSEIDSIRSILKENGYKNGYVTIDASDWYIDSRLRERLMQNPHAALDAFKKFYLDHLFDRAMYYEKLSFALTGRHISHTLLLHHNLAAALFLNDLIEMFKDKGWKIISADEAYRDPIFSTTPTHAGESLIWALAKDAGRFEPLLRYPAEDSRYEKDTMDALGL